MTKVYSARLMGLALFFALINHTIYATGFSPPPPLDDLRPGTPPPPAIVIEPIIDMPIDMPPAPIIGPWPPLENPIATIEVMARISPMDPSWEQFLDNWRIEMYPIDDDARPLASPNYAALGEDGNGLVAFSSFWNGLPMVIKGTNNLLPAFAANDPTGFRSFEIFIPAYCHDKAVWLLGPLEDALWGYYKKAAQQRGETWNPSQVDCGTWLANLQLVILTDQVNDELDHKDPHRPFDTKALEKALQRNQQFLTPTRQPICMAENRHNGGSLETGKEILLTAGYEDIVLDDFNTTATSAPNYKDIDPVVINPMRGLPKSICGTSLAYRASLKVNDISFYPKKHFWLDDSQFLGTVHQEDRERFPIETKVFNVRLGNGKERDLLIHDDACAMSTLIEFTNHADDEVDINRGSGIYLSDLFSDGYQQTHVYKTSDGDAVIDARDTWAIFTRGDSIKGEEVVMAVEVLGHRQEDFRDNVFMEYNATDDDLFIGLRQGFELNEEEVDGERAYLKYTVHVYNGSTEEGRVALRKDIGNCYESSDIWARQFFSATDMPLSPLDAAEFAVRSQCFSNSRSNQSWATDDAGYWSMTTDHGVSANLAVNAGWLAPDMDFEVYVQKFDEAVFKGPRTIATTDATGQLMVALPTIVEGDRILLKAVDSCCDDYDLVVPCVPEFTGFVGAPGIPYIPVTLGPPLPAVPPLPSLRP